MDSVNSKQLPLREEKNSTSKVKLLAEVVSPSCLEKAEKKSRKSELLVVNNSGDDPTWFPLNWVPFFSFKGLVSRI